MVASSSAVTVSLKVFRPTANAAWWPSSMVLESPRAMSSKSNSLKLAFSSLKVGSTVISDTALAARGRCTSPGRTRSWD